MRAATPVLRRPAASTAAGAPTWRPWRLTDIPKVPAASVAPAVALAPSAQEDKGHGGDGVKPAAAQGPGEPDRLRQRAIEEGRDEGLRLGMEEGRVQGYAAGLEAGRAQVEEQLGQLRALALSLPQALHQARSELVPELAALALEVARKVVHRHIEDEPEWIVRLVQDLLHAEPVLQGNPRVLLHPLDVPLVREALEPDLEKAGWQLRADEHISRGGCLVQAMSGSHDATLSTRWARMVSAIGVTPGAQD